jgi:hypothetical protein
MRAFSLRLNVAVMQIASQLFPTGFDVSDNAPDTFDKLKAHVAKTGRMLVWNGASDKTIFADEEVNFAFRAWHDWCHLAGEFPFTPEGEKDAACMQLQHIRALFGRTKEADYMCRLVWTEVVGQVEYHLHHNGAFPSDQAAFTKHYLVNPFSAVVMDY